MKRPTEIVFLFLDAKYLKSCQYCRCYESITRVQNVLTNATSMILRIQRNDENCYSDTRAWLGRPQTSQT